MLCAPLGCERQAEPRDGGERTERGEPRGPAAAARPNLLFVVWDTVRVDRTSLDPRGPETTPFVARWAEGGRVFENLVAAASTTTPSHASMFTGLWPSQHGTHADHPWLDDAYTTLAELLQAAGYATWLWSSNPHVSDAENLTQGFDVMEHPWQARWKPRAHALALAKAEPGPRERQRPPDSWALKSAGDLAPEALAGWLDDRPREGAKPFFAFVNWMEGHRPFIPPRALRERHLPTQWLERSYRADRDWRARWRHTFRIEASDPENLAIVAATYDVAIRELDALFARLLSVLDERGQLADTVVVLTADHGEHLGEHHRVDHQYSLYEELLRVPLVIHAPGRVAAGRDDREASGIDLFPTLLALVGLEAPGVRSDARDLLAPVREAVRERVAEYPAVFTRPFEWMRREHPGFDPAPWNRTLRALLRDDRKLIRGSDGSVELYDLASDPAEARNLAASEPARLAAMTTALDGWRARVASPEGAARGAPEDGRPRLTQEQREMLIGLGYAVDEKDLKTAPEREAETLRGDVRSGPGAEVPSGRAPQATPDPEGDRQGPQAAPQTRGMVP